MMNHSGETSDPTVDGRLDVGVEGGCDAASVSAWRALVAAHATVLESVERGLAAEQLVPLTWVDVLVALWDAPGHRLRLSDLARRVVHSRSGLTRLLDRMEAAGLVRREACPSDRRGAFAVITPAGRAVQLAAWPICARGITESFARHLSTEEATVLADALGRVAAAGAARCGSAHVRRHDGAAEGCG